MFGYFQQESGIGLELADFKRFSFEFSRVIRENIPTVETVRFQVAEKMQPALPVGEDATDRTLREAREQAAGTGNPVIIEDLLFMPFLIEDECIIAELGGLDDLLVRRVGSDWLEGLSDVLLREFLLVKRACVDPLTGLLSSRHLEEQLNGGNGGRQCGLLLISLYPKGTNVFFAKKYQYKVVSLLKSFVENQFPLYYVGQSCFVLVCDQCDDDFLSGFVPGLVNYLKRERCSRVHIGSTKICRDTEGEQSIAETIMKNAWAALHVASKRGPFAFCSYESIANADSHPFAPSTPHQRRWLQNVSRSCKTFSLLQFASCGQAVASAVSEEAGNTGICKVEGSNVFLFLPDTDVSVIRERAASIQNILAKNGEGKKVTVGISSFPLLEYKKSEMLLNCRKALRHAGFLEPGSVVVFDAVTLNISGDVYYGDGDLVQAVKEYKKGLLLDSHCGNLLNSLGVCYAQMNRRDLAVDCFEKASAATGDQFSALYNLGMEQQSREEKKGAMAAFERALALPVTDKHEVGAREDIRFQLAVLCIEEGQYERAIKLLLSWSEFKKESSKGKKAARYLGEAYYGVHKYKDAMTWLQRAMRYDEFDAEVLGLLGEIYLLENEGDDIALRFCEKSVELNPDSPALKVGLARAQLQCGDFKAAQASLAPCLRNKKIRPQALLQRGLLALALKQNRAAASWFTKVLDAPDSSAEVKKEARCSLKRIKK